MSFNEHKTGPIENLFVGVTKEGFCEIMNHLRMKVMDK